MRLPQGKIGSPPKTNPMLLLLKLSFLFAFCYGGCLLLNAQPNFSRWELGANIGTFIYQGDLTPAAIGSYKTPGLVLGLWVGRRLNKAFSLRGNLALGTLRGDDAKWENPDWRQQRNFNFGSPVSELSGQLVWNIGKSEESSRTRFAPYLFGGVGVAFLRIRRDWSNLNASYFGETDNVSTGLPDDINRRLPWVIPVVPVGAGVRYALSQKISLHAESAYRFTATDYLEGFSRSANPSQKDQYYNVSVGIIYKLGKRSGLDCPPVRQ